MSGGFDLHWIVHEDHEGGESEPTLLGLPMANGDLVGSTSPIKLV